MTEAGYLDEILRTLPLVAASNHNLTDHDANETVFGSTEEGAPAPNYTLQAVWWVIWMMGVEYLALWWQGAKLPCLHDNILCIVHAVFYEITKILVRGLEFGMYTWLWRQYRLFPASQDSFFTAAVIVVLIDLGYYWLHRASHEIMVLWAIHQVHHTSQDMTVAVGLRHSPLQRLFSWAFYLPLAVLGVSPSHMLIHVQFNLVYQCWIHTEAISTLGPLEYIFNTPTHHKVHHGCNMLYLDKNYGGVFIFWDHLFGTFKAPVEGEEVVYGILTQPDSFNILYNQVFYLKSALEKAFSMDTFWNGCSALIKGPSWVPGAPWTGFVEDKPNIKCPREYMPAKATTVTHLYIFTHLVVAIVFINYLNAITSGSPVAVFVYSIMVVAALTCISVIYEQPPYTRSMEILRCLIGLLLCLVMPPPVALLPHLIVLYSSSLALWLLAPGLVLCQAPVKQE